MSKKKTKILGAVMAGTLALGALVGTTAFAAGGLSLTPVYGVDLQAVAATAEPGTAVVVGKVDTAQFEGATTAPAASATLNAADTDVDYETLMKNVTIVDGGTLIAVKDLSPDMFAGQLAVTAPAK
jgi:hypothetical protein